MRPNDRRTVQNQPERDTLTTLLRSRSRADRALVAAGLQVIAVAGESAVVRSSRQRPRP